jgi:hypothetical protein
LVIGPDNRRTPALQAHHQLENSRQWRCRFDVNGGFGQTVIVKVAHIGLCHRRMLFVRAYPRETQEMVFDAHDRAFALFKGTCGRGAVVQERTGSQAAVGQSACSKITTYTDEKLGAKGGSIRLDLSSICSRGCRACCRGCLLEFWHIFTMWRTP